MTDKFNLDAISELLEAKDAEIKKLQDKLLKAKEAFAGIVQIAEETLEDLEEK